MRPTKWRAANGREIYFRKLGVVHLANILAMLERRPGHKRSVELYTMLSSPPPGGEQAQVAYADAVADYADVPIADLAIVPTYLALLAERDRRKMLAGGESGK